MIDFIANHKNDKILSLLIKHFLKKVAPLGCKIISFGLHN